jgi:ATP-dependent Zn protease
MTQSDIMAMIAQLLASREAELLLCGDASAGAGGAEHSDLNKATKLALALEGSLGLGSLGPLWLGEPDDLTHPSHRAWFGSRVGEILRHSAAEARRALIENRAGLERLAKALFDASYLDAAQIREALGAVKTIKLQPPPRHIDETKRESKDRDSERRNGRGRFDDKTSSDDQTPQRN